MTDVGSKQWLIDSVCELQRRIEAAAAAGEWTNADREALALAEDLGEQARRVARQGARERIKAVEYDCGILAGVAREYAAAWEAAAEGAEVLSVPVSRSYALFEVRMAVDRHDRRKRVADETHLP